MGIAPLRRKIESYGFSFSHSRPLEFRYLLECILLVLLVSNCACIKNYRTVGNYGLHPMKSEGSKSGREWHFDGLHYSKPISLSETIKKAMKVQVNNTTKTTAEAMKAEILEVRDPVLSSLLDKVKAEPRSAEAHFNLGVVYHRYRVLDKAYGEFQNAIRLNPVNAAYYEVMGRLWRDWRAPQLGINDLQRALQLKPDFVEAWNSLGTIYDAIGDFTQSQQCYLKALEINSDLDFVHNNLCFSFLQQGDIERAIYHGNIAVRLNPDFKVAHNNLGIAYGMGRNPVRALEEFKKACDEAGAHNNLGIVFLKRQEPSEAMEQFRIAAKLRPFYRVAAENYYFARRLKWEMERNGKKVAVKQDGPAVEVALENNALSPMISLRFLDSGLLGTEN
jgi:tetratricopeptide (TPR) repeat protein